MQYIYLINCQQFYKIGIANDVRSRLAQLSTGNPFDLKVLAVYGFENAKSVESAIHQRYSGVRKHGEWFLLDEHDLADFEQICQLLGGEREEVRSLPTEDEVDEAEEIQAEIMNSPKKWNYADMFSEGWGMNRANGGGGNYYWVWRRGSGTKREYLYGGRISDLPYSIEEIREKYA